MSLTVTNPDIVPLDSGALALVLPASAGGILALDGDGATGGAAIRLTDGASPSKATVRYAGAADTTDDIDFSSDGGTSWTYVPTAGNLASQTAVTHLRIRPQGAMAKQSSFSVSIPFLVR